MDSTVEPLRRDLVVGIACQEEKGAFAEPRTYFPTVFSPQWDGPNLSKEYEAKPFADGLPRDTWYTVSDGAYLTNLVLPFTVGRTVALMEAIQKRDEAGQAPWLSVVLSTRAYNLKFWDAKAVAVQFLACEEEPVSLLLTVAALSFARSRGAVEIAGRKPWEFSDLVLWASHDRAIQPVEGLTRFVVHRINPLTPASASRPLRNNGDPVITASLRVFPIAESFVDYFAEAREIGVTAALERGQNSNRLCLPRATVSQIAYDVDDEERAELGGRIRLECWASRDGKTPAMVLS